MDKRFSKEEWILLTKKLRNWVAGHFEQNELETVDRFIQLASASFDQISR